MALLNTPSVVMPGSLTDWPMSSHHSIQSVRSRTGEIDQNLPLAEQPRVAGTPSRKPRRKDIVLDSGLGLGGVEAIGDVDAHIHRVAHAAPLVMGEAEVAQDQALEPMEAAEHLFALDTAGGFAAHSLGQLVIRPLRRAADVEETLRLVPMHHVEIPDDVGRMLRGRPPRLLLRTGDEDGDTLVRVDLHAEIDAWVVQVFGAQRLPGVARGPVDHGVHLRFERLERDVAEVADEALEHFSSPDLPLDLGRAERFDQRVPVCVLGIEFRERPVDVIDAGISDHCRVPERGVLPGEATNELNGDGDALVGVVEPRDLELRQIEAFTQHIDADDDPAVEPPKRVQIGAPLAGRLLAVNDDGPKLRETGRCRAGEAPWRARSWSSAP